MENPALYHLRQANVDYIGANRIVRHLINVFLRPLYIKKKADFPFVYRMVGFFKNFTCSGTTYVDSESP